jgi:two-component system, OmpR family, response regulator
MHILIIEDDHEVSAHLTNGLRAQGYQVSLAADGTTGLAMAKQNHYSTLIIDRMLPKRDGLSVIKALRQENNTTPALILSALGDVDDRVEGLQAGGDDYLVKPFAMIELIARLEVLTRRGQPSTHSEMMLHADNVTLDVLRRKVTRGGKNVLLQAREFKLLEYLIRNKNQLVTRTMLLEHVWEYHFDPQTNVIDVHISRLRQKIDVPPHRPLITTIRGSGYIIEDTPSLGAA